MGRWRLERLGIGCASQCDLRLADSVTVAAFLSQWSNRIPHEVRFRMLYERIAPDRFNISMQLQILR